MKKYDMNGNIIAEGYFVETPFIKKGEYKETALDEYKHNVDFLITSCYKRYEIIFNKPTTLKETRSIKKVSNNAYLVTDKALETLKEQYTWACDF